MTTKQKQHLLAYLGYYTGAIDGVWGQQSLLATEKFQSDHQLPCDGIWGALTEAKILSVIGSGVTPTPTPTPTPTDDGWEDIKYFSKSEFRCTCGGRYCDGYPAEIDLDMAKIADVLRERLGKPIRVTSGVRCSRRNAEVGGVSNSQHLYGIAADLARPDGVTASQMAKIAEELMPNTGGIGIYSWGIHIDTRKSKSRWNG